MKAKTFLAIGGHIGDMDLTAGPLLTAAKLAGHHTHLLALTPGERGHPQMPPEEYKVQKINEGKEFAAKIGAGFEVLDYSDGFLPSNEEIYLEVGTIIRRLRPDVVIAHWNHSIHTDHQHASVIAEQARFYAGLPMEHELPRHGVSRVLYAQNWEDDEGYSPTEYVEIPEAAFTLWREAIEGQAFARGETYGFRYIDYYAALMISNGCLARVDRACAFAAKEAPGLNNDVI